MKRFSMIYCSMLVCSLALTGCNQSNQETVSTEAPVAASIQPSESAADENLDETKEPAQEKQEAKNKEDMNYYELYEETGEIPSLHEIYKDLFSVGVAMPEQDIENKEKTEFVAKQFNSLTCENEMKADFTLSHKDTVALGDQEKVALDMNRADKALTFAKENNIKMRAHTLVWHSQTPRWLFTVGYDEGENAPFVTREVMLKRMENYIKTEMEYVNTNYPGVVYAWDVVNEAIALEDGHKDGLRMKNSYWYQVVGDDYIERAFEFARKYAAEDQKLFYNDYGTFEKNKLTAIYNLASKLKEKGWIDGIGMQSHIQLDNPELSKYEEAIKKYGELGLEIQITELDIDTKENTEEVQEKLGKRYKKLMMTLCRLKKNGDANITSVTLWGLSDNRSWLNGKTPSYPLLFDAQLQPKPAFFGMVQDDSILI